MLQEATSSGAVWNVESFLPLTLQCWLMHVLRSAGWWVVALLVGSPQATCCVPSIPNRRSVAPDLFQ